jgi:hypothetical protein
VFKVYLDESGSPDDTTAVVVAGFLATSEQWTEFESNWKEAMAAFGVTALHMKDFAHSVREFSAWKRDEQKRQRFLSRLINIIRTRVRRGFAHAVLMDDYRQVNRVFFLYDIIRPYAIAGRTCVASAARWAQRHNIDENRISYVFEDGAIDRGDLIHRLKRDGKFNFAFAKKSESAALQAADLLAYEHLLTNTKISKGIIDSYEQLRHPMKELDKINHGGDDWGTYTAKDLEALCINMKIPRRPREEGGATIITSSDGSLEVRVETPDAEGKVAVEARQLIEGHLRAFIDIVSGNPDDCTRLEYQTQNPVKRWLLSASPREVNISCS